MQIFNNTNIDFVRWRWHALALSLVVIIAGMAMIATKGLKKGVDFVLAGSIRDDGPLPDVVTDTLQAQELMRERVRGVSLALMMATTLHAIATGNLLPATVKTVLSPEA